MRSIEGARDRVLVGAPYAGPAPDLNFQAFHGGADAFPVGCYLWLRGLDARDLQQLLFGLEWQLVTGKLRN